jgi:hypothetical protein
MFTDRKEMAECFRGISVLCCELEVLIGECAFVLLVDIGTVTSHSNVRSGALGKAGVLWHYHQ